MRKTAAYRYLIRRIQQPEVMAVCGGAEKLLRDTLVDSPFIDYEVRDLLRLNVPYFWQRAGESRFYDGDGRCYEGYLKSTGVEGVRRRLKALCPEGCAAGIDMIRKLTGATACETP